VVVAIGTGSDRRIVPPFANAGEEATMVNAATMIATQHGYTTKRIMFASARHQLTVMPRSLASIDFAQTPLHDRAESELKTCSLAAASLA
jgi:hypothetical protein